MKTNSEALLIGLCLAMGWAVITIARGLMVPLVALLLTLAGWRSSSASPFAPAAPEALAVHPSSPLTALTVVELRLLARQAGLKALARSGRKADLLMALA